MLNVEQKWIDRFCCCDPRKGRKAHPRVAAALLATSIGNQWGKGHHYRGRLTAEQAKAVLIRCASGERSVVVAKEFGILRQQVDRIRNRDRWSNLAIPADIAANAIARKYAAGSKNPASKLTEPEVREIKARLATGEHYEAIAIDFGVTKGVVQHIKHGRQWRHVSV